MSADISENKLDLADARRLTFARSKVFENFAARPPPDVADGGFLWHQYKEKICW